MKILIATDGSSASESVVEAAFERIVDPESTEVKIVSAVEPYAQATAEPFAVSSEFYARLQEDLSKHAENFIEQAVVRLNALCPGLGKVSSEILHGFPAQAIVETARTWNADLIVVGSHGYGFWSRTLLGSVSNSVVHHAPCSVLIVRDRSS